MIELFMTYLVGALIGGTILGLWIRHSIWPRRTAAERFEARRAFVHRIPD